MALCKECGATLAVQNRLGYCKLHKNMAQPSRYAANKARYRDGALMRLYGINQAGKDALLAAQHGCCAICKAELSTLRTSPKFACVDHCHKTGRVRGILCKECNTAIGMLQDSTDFLLAAVDYLGGSVM